MQQLAGGVQEADAVRVVLDDVLVQRQTLLEHDQLLLVLRVNHQLIVDLLVDGLDRIHVRLENVVHLHKCKTMPSIFLDKCSMIFIN